jgi:hypothetical protein
MKVSSQSTAGVRLCSAFGKPHQNFTKMLGQNHFAEPNWHVLIFLHPKVVID